jgi:lipoprotein-anchoring transpeptidase ErfK/SrfK
MIRPRRPHLGRRFLACMIALAAAAPMDPTGLRPAEAHRTMQVTEQRAAAPAPSGSFLLAREPALAVATPAAITPTPALSPSSALATAPAAAEAPTVPEPVMAIHVKRILNVQGPFRHGDFVWDESGAPTTGPVVITVDLKAQTLSVLRDGYEIGTAVILYGADDKPTPLGTYRISQKKVDHISNLYNAPMPYMMRLTNDGVAIHASEVAWGNATHGCIGVPLAFAKKLFAATPMGTPVVVTSGKMLAGR